MRGGRPHARADETVQKLKASPPPLVGGALLILISLKKGASEDDNFFFQKTDSPQKWGERRSDFFFKESNITLT